MSINQLIRLKQDQIKKIEEEIKDLQCVQSSSHENANYVFNQAIETKEFSTLWEKIKYLRASKQLNNETTNQVLNQVILNKDYAGIILCFGLCIYHNFDFDHVLTQKLRNTVI